MIAWTWGYLATDTFQDNAMKGDPWSYSRHKYYVSKHKPNIQLRYSYSRQLL